MNPARVLALGLLAIGCGEKHSTPAAPVAAASPAQPSLDTLCSAALDNLVTLGLLEDAPSADDAASCLRVFAAHPQGHALLACQAAAADRATWGACHPDTDQGNRVHLQVERMGASREIAASAGILGALAGASPGAADERGLGGGIGGLIGEQGPPVDQGSPGSGVQVTGEPIILGSLDPDLVKDAVADRIPDLRSCYETSLSDAPDLAGKLVVKFIIAPDGTVKSSKTQSSTLGDEAVAACVHELLGAMTFPEPPGGGIVIVSYPFVFAPG